MVSGFGLLGVLDRDEEAAMCHECGLWFRTLGPHLRSVHELTADEYRQAHQLPAQQSLTGVAAARTNSERARSRVGTPEWGRFTEARDRILPTARAMGVEANQATSAGTRAGRAADARQRLTPPGADERRWQQQLAAYRGFVEIHHRAPSRGADDEAELRLAVWAKNQRAQARQGKLSQSRRAALADAAVGVLPEG